MSYATLADVKARLSHYTSEVQRTHERVVITKNGLPAAVLISPDDLDSLEETLEIMSDPELMAAIAQGEAELTAGLGEELTEFPLASAELAA